MPRFRILLLIVAAVAVVGGVSLIVLGLRDGGTLAASGTSGRPGAGSAGQPSASSDAAERARREQARRERALTAALKAHAAKSPEFSVAVLDHDTGALYAFRGKEKYETASVVKVDVLAAVLLRAQNAGRSLSESELSLAQQMIRASDNDATTTLFNQVGGRAGLAAANKQLGLTATAVQPAWGLTRTTVTDQARLLAELVDEAGPLTAKSRRLALDLMATVNADQRWGVSAAARSGERVAIKNGWLSRSTEGGRWIINSVGRITGDDVDVSLVVLSHGHGSMESGVAAVEDIAELTREHLKW